MSPVSFAFVFVAVLMTCWTNVHAQVSQQEVEQIVAMHNTARAAVSPPASNMQQIAWDSQLAASAQTYANTCPSGHSGTKGVGENLSWGWPTMTVSSAVSMWANEKTYYTYSSKSCQSGQSCGHYTQMIWATSTKVGCGKKACSSLIGRGKGDVWVCQYSPAGNIVGQQPYKTASVQNPAAQTPSSPSLTNAPVSGQSPASPTMSQPSSVGQQSPASPTMSQPSSVGQQPPASPTMPSAPAINAPAQATPSYPGSAPALPANQPIPQSPVGSGVIPGPGPMQQTNPGAAMPETPVRSVNNRRRAIRHGRRHH